MSPVPLVLVAEGTTDRDAIQQLTRRVLLGEAPEWARDGLDERTLAWSDLLQWRGLEVDGFTTWPQLTKLLSDRNIRFRRRGGTPAMMEARKAVVAFELLGLGGACLIVHRDAGDLQERHPADFRAAVHDGQAAACAHPVPEIEAWYLCGLEPQSGAERDALVEVSTELGFDPARKPSRLRARSSSPRSVKRVLARLIGAGSVTRREACLDAPLGELAGRDPDTGLGAFLQAVRAGIAPRVFGRS